jgi:hypothetical protein
MNISHESRLPGILPPWSNLYLWQLQSYNTLKLPFCDPKILETVTSPTRGRYLTVSRAHGGSRSKGAARDSRRCWRYSSGYHNSDFTIMRGTLWLR